ncbi:MAG TPA: SDR family oxidoreductase [Mariprofundaceae bacterium]|nr:SDR family oxidoreductase [Mariprofundaceae bacterium]
MNNSDGAGKTARYSRIAIVTGASSGIGEATVRRFVSSGFAVVGNARSADKLGKMERELGEAFCAVAGDAGDRGVIDQLFATSMARFGRPADIVVANAGRGLGGAVTEADLEQFEEILKLNVTGTLALIQEAARQMVEKQASDFHEKAADIVVIGSVVGRNISPFSAVYGSTKYAVHALTEGLRREVGPKGVRVSLVEPGIVVSGFQDAAGYDGAQVTRFHEGFGPLLYGEDIANAIGFIVEQPPHVHVSDIMVRPTRQDYP